MLSEKSDAELDRDREITLYAADPDCDHDIRMKWSGVECLKCRGWFCY